MFERDAEKQTSTISDLSGYQAMSDITFVTIHTKLTNIVQHQTQSWEGRPTV